MMKRNKEKPFSFMLILKLSGSLKANSLNTTISASYDYGTTDLPRRVVASETFKEQRERKNWFFTTKYGQCYISFYNVSIFTYFSCLQ